MHQGRVYRNGTLTTDTVSPDTLSSLVGKRDVVYWLDLVQPTKNDVEVVGAALGLDQFHIEDAYKGKQRPKLELAERYLYINAYTTAFDRETTTLTSEEIAIFVTRSGIVTIRDNPDSDLTPLLNRWDTATEMGRRHSVDYLIWGLLDIIVDEYFETLEVLDDEVEKLEDKIFATTRNDPEMQHLSYDLRKALVITRRLTLPMREIVGPLLRQDVVPISAEMAIHFHDVYDHVIRVADWTESLRDLITTLLETNLTIQSNYMNSIMKKVTSWAAIIAVPTAITGFYGQNVPYPGFSEQSGFWVSTGSIIVISTTLYLIFKKRDWL